MLIMPKHPASSAPSSMLILLTLRSGRSATISSRTGLAIRHVPYQGAQKSSSTVCSERTASCSKSFTDVSQSSLCSSGRKNARLLPFPLPRFAGAGTGSPPRLVYVNTGPTGSPLPDSAAPILFGDVILPHNHTFFRDKITKWEARLHGRLVSGKRRAD